MNGPFEIDLSSYADVARRQHVPTRIKTFHGEAAFLSSFWAAPITFDGIEFPTVEHAYQAAKTLDFHRRYEISKIATPGQAKRAGQKVTLRPDWENIKEQIMLELVILKFMTHRKLRDLLLSTGHAELIEGNTWGDTYWGVCNGVGQNVLGKVLMLVRGQLR